MVRPRNFGFNPETAENNAFQSNTTDLTPLEISEKAVQEFDTMVDGLRNFGVNVIVFEDTALPKKTDAVYPNNWFTTHSSGDLFLYPMYSPNRRLERRTDVVKQISEDFHLKVNKSLLQAENDYKAAQVGYLNSVYDVLIANVELKKSTGQLK